MPFISELEKNGRRGLGQIAPARTRILEAETGTTPAVNIRTGTAYTTTPTVIVPSTPTPAVATIPVAVTPITVTPVTVQKEAEAIPAARQGAFTTAIINASIPRPTPTPQTVQQMATPPSVQASAIPPPAPQTVQDLATPPKPISTAWPTPTPTAPVIKPQTASVIVSTRPVPADPLTQLLNFIQNLFKNKSIPQYSKPGYKGGTISELERGR